MKGKPGSNPISKEEHIEVHKKLHQALDELVADMILHTEMRPSKTTVLELMMWSNEQTENPSDKGD